MAGDHQQLPPTIKSDVAAKELGTTLLEKTVALHPEAVVLLEEQYRMNEAIAGFSSQEFYGGRLRAAPPVAHWKLFDADAPLHFIDTAGCGFEEVYEGTSISNPEEAHFLVRQLGRYVAELKAFYPGERFPSIAVISPYRHQVEILKEAVQSSPELQEVIQAVSVNTIDSFQGQERDAVFISMTRSNAESTIGFLSDVRRMNVAMTRARKKLVVVGDSATISQSPFYAGFIAYAQELNAYQSAWELVDW
jgi:superfamily I DNA and/or RNA helicase